MFLGEHFNADNCNAMCDNCSKKLEITQRDLTSESLKIIDCLNDINERHGKITLLKLVELAKGKAASKTVWLKKDIIDDHKGFLKSINESEIRRLLIKLLILGVLEEVFVSVTQNNTILVYLQVKNHVEKLRSGRLKVILSQGFEKQDEMCIGNDKSFQSK